MNNLSPQDRDEGDNFTQRHNPELVKEELRPLVFEEVRQQVRGWRHGFKNGFIGNEDVAGRHVRGQRGWVEGVSGKRVRVWGRCLGGVAGRWVKGWQGVGAGCCMQQGSGAEAAEPGSRL